MAAPKGNSFYLLRSKSGRNRKYTSAEALIKACYEYFSEVDNNPWKKNEFNSKANKIVQIPTARPYTLTGLFIFIGISRTTWETYKGTEDFLSVITHVEEIIYTQKFEGAAVGAFNANIIARDLGLKENSSVEHSGSIIWNETKTYEK